jgi:CBS domain-containing protein
MTGSPVVGNKSNKFSQILRLFTEFPVHHLPIVDDHNKLIGIVSTNDLPRIFLSLSNRPNPLVMTPDALDREVSVTDLMTPNPVTIASTAPISAATAIFAEHRFAALPVVDDGTLVGILSSKDVMTYINQS